MATAQTATHPLPAGQRLIVTVGVMLAVLLQVLDTTIANVALPHMSADLGATQEQINWVLTSYIIASAIALPMSGWLADRVGRKRLLLISVIGFTISSTLCAMATSLPEMVAFRAVQGVSGAFIVPLAQATLFDINPREKHGQAMALFGGGVMIGPILGPVLGGWLTDSYNWRWVFLVNLPVGVICFFLMTAFMPTTETRKRRFDLFGFTLLAVALASLQMFLDRGNQKDWFDSWEIIIEAGLAVAAFWMFLVHTITAKQPLWDREMFADRNFASALVFMVITGVLLLAGLALLPPLLQNLYGYSVLQSGFLTAPRGVGTLISMLVAGRLTSRMDARILVGVGVVLMGISLWMMTGFAIDQPSRPVIVSGVVQGLGLGLIFVPLQTLAFATLPARDRTTGAALLNLARNVGGSVGISVVSFQLARMAQVAHADMASHITDSKIPTLDPNVLQTFGNQAVSVTAFINAEITRQALFIAYLDDFKLMMWISFLVLPLLLLMRNSKKADDTPLVLD
ncbi:DHA2 family efflux MFS transporter permease subunit [Sphingomonas sp. RG327]|jgi:DHA2 family multidrug resistance protein|uniref:DHA2 family efflux MFS transporter permease subunit n=1 Tax=Sphingomonas anseongensis TaxID=2908207 RepID=A0ABT0RDG5_9SPHN|nr:DHA2 family efflux MFS transporter permease subunit [Sphingomonas anseongensis]MCL6678297.1 DHA2 family efflux MFS transporter permease subunit [Sphingomonas anseongensis]